jgi:hypothetical protein
MCGCESLIDEQGMEGRPEKSEGWRRGRGGRERAIGQSEGRHRS